MTADTTAAPRRGRPRDERCDHAILRATLDIIAESGAASLSIDGVASRAGVGKATIYRRWSSKEALVLEALSTDDVTIDTPDTGSLHGDLTAYCAALVERLTAAPRADLLPHLIEAACHDADVRRSLDDYVRQRQTPLRDVLQRARTRGELDPALDTNVVVDMIVGPLIYRHLMTGQVLDDAYVAAVLDVLLGGHGLRRP